MQYKDVFDNAFSLREGILKSPETFKEVKDLQMDILVQIISEVFRSPYLPENIPIKPMSGYSRSYFIDTCTDIFSKLGINYKFIRAEVTKSTSYIFKNENSK